MVKDICWNSEKAKGSGKKIQDAHEAIRPTQYGVLSLSEIKESLQVDQFRLYQLIWRRFYCQ